MTYPSVIHVFRTLAKRSWLAVAAVGALGNVLTFFPGYLDPDTTWQLQQAMTGNFHDWHPPAMAWVWRQLLVFIPGPGGMFLLNVAMFWIGLSLLIHTALRSRVWAAFFTLLIGWLPWNSPVLAQVWKDAGMTAAMTLAFGLLATRSRAAQWFAIFPLVYAALLRHNALAAVVPPLVFLIAESRAPAWFARGKISKPVATAGLSLIACAALVVGSATFTRVLLAGKKTFPAQVLMNFDLGGLTVRAGTNLYPPIYHTQYADVARVFLPFSAFYLLWPAGDRDRLQPRPGFVSGEAEVVREVRNQWLKSIFNYPAEYVLHRLAFFRSFLGIGIGRERGGFWFHVAPEMAHYSGRLQKTSWNSTYLRWVLSIQETFPFRAITHLILLLLAGGVWLRTSKLLVEVDEVSARTRRLEGALFISAVLYLLSFLIAGVAVDYRYSWWLTIAASVLALRAGLLVVVLVHPLSESVRERR